MKYLLLVCAVFFLTGFTCHKVTRHIPACIEGKIERIKGEPEWNPRAEVNEYVYNDQRVFLFSANCCDQYHVLYDENCSVICAPSGGYTGRGDGKCPDFNETARHIRLVWKDER